MWIYLAPFLKPFYRTALLRFQSHKKKKIPKSLPSVYPFTDQVRNTFKNLDIFAKFFKSLGLGWKFRFQISEIVALPRFDNNIMDVQCIIPADFHQAAKPSVVELF